MADRTRRIQKISLNLPETVTMKPEPFEMKMEIPSAFATACKALHIFPQQALQQFIDQLSVHACIMQPAHEQEAMAIFKAYIDQRGFIPPPDAARKLHTRCLQQLVRLIRSKSSPAKKEQAYQRLVNEWSNSLTITQ